MKIALLGPKGTYSEEAAKKYSADAELVYTGTHQEVFEKVKKGQADEGIIAIENQLDGTIVENLDLFFNSMLFIKKEIVLAVHHNLITLPGAKNISKIMSHPKALNQCKAHIAGKYPNAKLIERPSTANALEELAEKKLLDTAVVGSIAGAEHYGLEIKEKGIEDYPYNATRFLVISKEEKREGNKTSVLFVCAHKPGALWECIGSFAKNGVSLGKIESRPIRERSWEYLFFLDLEGGLQEKSVKKSLQDLQEHTSLIRVLGSYEKGEPDDK